MYVTVQLFAGMTAASLTVLGFLVLLMRLHETIHALNFPNKWSVRIQGRVLPTAVVIGLDKLVISLSINALVS